MAEKPSLPRAVLALARVPNVPTVWTNVLAGWLLAGGGFGWRLPAAMAGGTLLYAAGCTLNDAFDEKWDRAHKPDRLIPSGAMSARSVWRLGFAEMAAGVLLFALAAPGAWWLPLLLAAAILLYDLRHKETPWSVVVMGACRALLTLSAGAAALDSAGGPPAAVFIAAAALWIYIIALSLLARRETRPGGGFLKKLRPEWSVGRWVGEMLAAIPLLDAALLLAFTFRHGALPLAALFFCLAMWPLCRLLQKTFAAT